MPHWTRTGLFDIIDIKRMVMKHEATDLLIREVDPRLKSELRKRARAHGRSLSDEAKLILRKGVGETPPLAQAGLGTQLFSMLPDEFRGDDLVFEYSGGAIEPPDFE